MKAETILEINDISKRFFGMKPDESFWVLKEIDISIRRGKISALIGANGAGKTTLFNILSGFLRPDAGSISFFDVEGKSHRLVHASAERTQRSLFMPVHQIAALGIGRLFQDVKMYSHLSLIENVMMGSQNRCGEYPFSHYLKKNKKVESERLQEALRIIDQVLGDALSEEIPDLAPGKETPSNPKRGLSHICRTWMNSYLQYGDIFVNPLYRYIQHDVLLRNAGEFSFGQQRLIALAGLFMGDCDLLLLDEPTAGVNPQMIKKILNLIRYYVDSCGKTVIMIEHNMEAVLKVADDCYFMDDGHIKHFGSPADVLGNPKVRREYLGV